MCYSDRRLIIRTHRDLHLDGVSGEEITPSLVLKRAAEHLAEKNDVKDTSDTSYNFA